MTDKILLPVSRRRIIKGVLAAGIAAPALLNSNSAFAAYPDRPVHVVVANTPGGPSDMVARVLTAALQQSTGKTFIVDNIGGAGSNLGMGHVARSTPDGYELLLATNAYSVNASLYSSIPYDPIKDFVGVSEVATTPDIFAVRSELPVKTMKEFVELASKNPDKFNISTSPIGTSGHLQCEMLKIRANLPKMEIVVFKGGGDALQALLSNTVQINAGAIAPTLPHVQSGALRCLAITAETRWPDLPDVPTMAESGFPDFNFAVDCVLMAPAKTPPDIVKWLERETLKVLSTQDMKDRLYKAGFLVRPKGGDAAYARVTKEVEIFRDLINKAGIKKL
ncbi:MAG TPA: tripartite tricarboxylate transporter substrate binding protein [Pseudolabrys sp.]|jgi:tripartite-type tricarboxylate transporter receptor subunit TctC